MSPKKTSASVKALRDAEKAVEKARVAHRVAFRKALAQLFNEYGLALQSANVGGRLEIVEQREAFAVEELPE